jgi:hypothetical protein
MKNFKSFNSLNAELNPICHLLALLGVHHILHISRIRVNYVFVHSGMVEAKPVRLTSQFRSPCQTAQRRRSHIFNWKGVRTSKNHKDFNESLNRKKLLSQMNFSDGSDGEMKWALLLIKRPPVQPLSVHMPENVVKVSAIHQLQSKEVGTKHTHTSSMPDR